MHALGVMFRGALLSALLASAVSADAPKVPILCHDGDLNNYQGGPLNGQCVEDVDRQIDGICTFAISCADAPPSLPAFVEVPVHHARKFSCPIGFPTPVLTTFILRCRPARPVVCVDGQPPSGFTVAKWVNCDADGQVNGVCTFIPCALCTDCEAPIDEYLCDVNSPVAVVSAGRRGEYGRQKLRCLPGAGTTTVRR